MSEEATSYQREEREEVQALDADRSRLLLPGDHLLEIALAGETTRELLTEGLLRMGFVRAVVDESVRAIEATTSVLVLATLESHLRIVDTDAVHWGRCRTLASVPFGDLHFQLRPFPLAQDRTYEIRFLSRMKSHPTKDRVVEVLRAMRGFECGPLLALKRDMRIPGHPGTSATLWFGIARWFGPHSHVNMDDPVCFEDVVEAPS